MHHGVNHLWRLHVDNFGDAPLHDQKVRIVHVEADGVEQVLNTVQLHDLAVDQVLVAATNHNLITRIRAACSCNKCCLWANQPVE